MSDEKSIEDRIVERFLKEIETDTQLAEKVREQVKALMMSGGRIDPEAILSACKAA